MRKYCGGFIIFFNYHFSTDLALIYLSAYSCFGLLVYAVKKHVPFSSCNPATSHCMQLLTGRLSKCGKNPPSPPTIHQSLLPMESTMFCLFKFPDFETTLPITLQFLLLLVLHAAICYNQPSLTQQPLGDFACQIGLWRVEMPYCIFVLAVNEKIAALIVLSR